MEKSSHIRKFTIRIKAALSCCACDVPASRKVCGFLAHKATLGCNKCLRDFPTVPHQMVRGELSLIILDSIERIGF